MNLNDVKYKMVLTYNIARKPVWANPEHIVTITFMESHEGNYHMITMSNGEELYAK